MKKENPDNIYVMEKIVGIEKENSKGILKSLRVERWKAFFTWCVCLFLLVFYNFEIHSKVGNIFLHIILYLVIYFSALGFLSKKIKNMINVKGNLDRDWTNKRVKFLKFYYEVLRNNINDQKKELTIASKRVKYSAFLLVIFLFLNLFE